jgi:hypothetical protein
MGSPSEGLQIGPAQHLVGKIEMAMSANGLAPVRETIGGPVTVVGATSRFRWQWMGTKLYAFIYAASFLPGTSAAFLDQFLDAAIQNAINRKGALRGFQIGVAAVTVAVVDSATPEQVAWASQPHGRRFAAITFPVLADASSRRVVYPQRMVLGGIYLGYLQELVRSYVETQITN